MPHGPNPPLVFATDCLYSHVKNVSGAQRRFTFLPPHGRQLDVDEELTVFGSILEAVNRGDRFGGRFMTDLENAVGRGDLEIKSLPNPILTDLNDGSVKMIALDTGSLTVVDPCYETSLSL